jgi:hypothetical protein
LATIETWVANGLVPIIKVVVRDVVCATRALGDIIASEFNVNSTRPCAFCLVRANESGNLIDNRFKVTSLATVWSSDGVSMHGIASPYDWVTSIAYCVKKWSK